MPPDIPLVDLKAQYLSIQTEIDAAVANVLSSCNFILGPDVRAFEEAFAAYLGAQDAVGVASGTAALQLALLACGVGPGDEVITTAHTFMATAEAISLVGARPVFVDIDPLTYTLDPACAARAITERTRALLPVHLYGHPAEMDALWELASRHGLWLIEDAAQAVGAEYHGKRCGSIGHLACFSFYPAKNLGAYGDAGAVTGNDQRLLARVRRLRDHGRTAKYEHEEIGYGERLDALQAAVLSAKLPYLESWTEARRAHARAYDAALAGCDVVTPHEAAGVRHVYYVYVVRTPDRPTLMAYLQSQGIATGIYYPLPLHRQPAYLKQGYSAVSLPITERVAGEVLALPMYPELTPGQMDRVVDAVRAALAAAVPNPRERSKNGT
jgi:dTDP-4-amino-4,6-dideoxygalactose transaminase